MLLFDKSNNIKLYHISCIIFGIGVYGFNEMYINNYCKTKQAIFFHYTLCVIIGYFLLYNIDITNDKLENE